MGAASSDPGGARNPRICCGCSKEETARLLGENEEDAAESTEDIASVIQFMCPIFFCKENEGVVEVDVVRFGDASQVATVDYYTADSSAKAGKKYFAQSGTLRFAPEETTQVLSIKLIDDDEWDATLEFAIHLKKVRGAQLGKYLNVARVKIIDDDSFPTNKYADFFSDTEKEEEIPSLGIFVEFCKMNMKDSTVFWGTVKSFMLDQIKNLYFFLTLYLQMYLVDVVLEEPKGEEEEAGREEEDVAEEGQRRRLLLRFIHAAARRLEEAAEGAGGEEEGEDGLIPKVLIIPGNRKYTAIIVGLIYIVPFVTLHWIDIKKLSLGVAGAARARLQTNLLRKFLNYMEEHRSRISMGDLQMTMVRDVTEVVNFGYMKLLSTCAIIGKLTLALVFILAENKMAVIPLALYPVVMGLFLCVRGKVTVSTCEEMALQQNNVVQIVSETALSYRLIADFALRPLMVDSYEEQVEEFNKREIAKTMVATNNMYLPPWLTTILIGVYMMTAPLQVVTFGGPLTLGAFLATINIFKEVGVELAEIYMEIMEIQKSVGPLRKLCHFMNLETDLETRMKINRGRRAMGAEKRAEARRSISGTTACGANGITGQVTGGTHHGSLKTDKGEQVFAVDVVPIEIKNLTFCFEGIMNEALFKAVSATFDQGMLYAIVGPAHEGKSTLLKLLGQVLLPDDSASGFIFIPPHLRVLHLSQETFVMSASLVRNIVFNTDIEKVGGMDRITRICKLLRFPDYMLSELKEPVSDKDGLENESEASHMAFRHWMAKLSNTDFARLNLARAFVMNPECLVLHKPTLAFDDSEKLNVIQLLRRHVDHRGLELPEENRKFRRRRTTFFTCASMAGIITADSVYEVSKANGLRVISKDEGIAEVTMDVGKDIQAKPRVPVAPLPKCWKFKSTVPR